MPTPEEERGDSASPGYSTSLTLLARLQANDGDAWARLVRLYRPLVAYWGGRWHVTMRTPDGHDRGLGGEYREIVPMRRLVMTHVWEDEGGRPGPQTLVTVSFEDLGGRTRVTLVQSGFDSEDARKGHEGGWSECLDILAEQ